MANFYFPIASCWESERTESKNSFSVPVKTAASNNSEDRDINNMKLLAVEFVGPSNCCSVAVLVADCGESAGMMCDVQAGEEKCTALPAPADQGKVFNDCVHGHITLHPVCVSIIDTPEFQRLRNIKQTGSVYFVYPGASHNRFEHCLGVCYLAGKMVDVLNHPSCKITPTQKLCLQIAGLCHDLGHGPFSHTWEKFLKIRGKDWKHEDASVLMFEHLLGKHLAVREMFSQHNLHDAEIELIKELICGKGTRLKNEEKYLFEVISNEENGIDVDKWDYLLRDGLQLNLKITFDYKRLLHFSRIVEVNGKKHICFQNKTVTDVYNMFQMRALLHHLAYQHTVAKNIELMLVDALIEADVAGFTVNTKDNKYKLSEAHQSMDAFSCLTDHIFYQILYSKQEHLARASGILERILTRDLYTLVGSRQEDVASTDVEQRIKQLRNDLEQKLAAAAEIEKYDKKNFSIEIKSIDKGCKNLDDPFSGIFFFKKNTPNVASSISSKSLPIFGCSSTATSELKHLCSARRHSATMIASH